MSVSGEGLSGDVSRGTKRTTKTIQTSKRRMIGMLSGTESGRPDEAGLEPFEALEFELALDLQDPARRGFESAVQEAADVVGGDLLFDIPADKSIEDASRIAAVRIPDAERDRIFFAVLDAAGTSIRMASRKEIGERFYGFARAFVGVLERIRDDRSLGGMRPEGSA